MSVTLTERAANEVKKIMADQKMGPELMLRVGVAGGGCSGFQYALGFDEKFDEKVDAKREYHGVTIVVDKKSDLYLDGTTVDFYEDIEPPRFHVRQSERREELRLRQFVPGVTAALLPTQRFAQPKNFLPRDCYPWAFSLPRRRLFTPNGLPYNLVRPLN